MFLSLPGRFRSNCWHARLYTTVLLSVSFVLPFVSGRSAQAVRLLAPEQEPWQPVYGLRRAFVLAGAETLVMSLWPVSDRVTRELMTRYYEGLKQGQGRGEALRQMQLDMLKRKGRQHPFYWASFIQSGEWANLEGKR
jgi:hypothetical protein